MTASTRTCVVCRQREGREELLRLVRHPDGSVVVDVRARLPGRGVWVHPRRACVERLEQRPGMLRRHMGEVDCRGLLNQTRSACMAQLLDGLSFGAASGALVGGHDVLVRDLKAERVRAVLTASDASERTLKSLRAASTEGVSFLMLPMDRASLGRRVGKGERAAIGVLASRSTRLLLRQLHRLLNLG